MSNLTEYRWPDFRFDRISLEQLDISSSFSLSLSLFLFLSFSLSFFLPIDSQMFQFAKNETKFNPGRKQVCARALKTPTSYRKHLFRNFWFQFVALQLSMINLSMYNCPCSICLCTIRSRCSICPCSIVVVQLSIFVCSSSIVDVQLSMFNGCSSIRLFELPGWYYKLVNI